MRVSSLIWNNLGLGSKIQIGSSSSLKIGLVTPMLGAMDPWSIKPWANFWKKILLWLKSTMNWLRNKICFKKIQALISFDFRFKFFLSSSMCFFCYHFSHAIIVVMFFSWCISSIGTKDQISTLCYNVRYFFTLQLL